MGGKVASVKRTVGFLTVIENQDQGLFGGFLLLNLAGRPLEFHCTAPIKPSRAQQILYGPTLQPYLFGEQIGQTLLSKAKKQPSLVCTDRQPVLAVADHVDIPVVLVIPDEGSSTEEPQGGENPDGCHWRVDGAHSTAEHLREFRFGDNRLAMPVGAESCEARIQGELGEVIETFDLSEPFDRIRDAIKEAQRGA